jgi:hypothetical protein
VNAATQYQLTNALDQLADDLAGSGWQLHQVNYHRTLATRGEAVHEQLGEPDIEVILFSTDATDGGKRQAVHANGWPGVFAQLDALVAS